MEAVPFEIEIAQDYKLQGVIEMDSFKNNHLEGDTEGQNLLTYCFKARKSVTAGKLGWVKKLTARQRIKRKGNEQLKLTPVNYFLYFNLVLIQTMLNRRFKYERVTLWFWYTFMFS